MRQTFRKGLSFGVTSGIITTLGLMTGLEAGTGSRAVVLGGIVTIAIADSLSDALGMHLSEESSQRSLRRVWDAAGVTFMSKFLLALSFSVPVLLFPLGVAWVVCLCWGALLLSLLSWWIARVQEERPWRVVAEHVLIAAVVVVLTRVVGRWLGSAP
ncbi:hypothetical protein JXA12_00455 [Candidatus Woesearchaeota archaeon]|nr:hypothetical protein [Candidatus Woesearchaeota archaeon]